MTALTDRPARLLLRMHLRKLSGQMRLRGRGLDAKLWVRNGVLWAARDVPELFASLGARLPKGIDLQDDLLADIPALMAAGLDLNTIMDAASNGVGDLLAQSSLDPEILAEFEAEVDPPAGAFASPTPLLRSYTVALRKLQSAGEVADELAGWSTARLRVETALGEDLSPLGPIAVRTLALARRNRILGDLVRNSGRGQLQRTQEAWLAVNLLRQLGLVRIPDAPQTDRSATLKGLSPPTPAGASTPSSPETTEPEAPAPERTRPEPMRPPPSRRRKTSQARPSGLAAFAASAGSDEELPEVEIEDLGGAWSSQDSRVVESVSFDEDDDANTQPLPTADFLLEDDPDDEEAEIPTGRLQHEVDEDEITGPLDSGPLEPEVVLEDPADEGDMVFAMGEDEDEWDEDEDDDASEEPGTGTSDMVFAMGEDEEEEWDEDEDEDDAPSEEPATGTSDMVFAMGEDDEEEWEDDEDSGPDEDEPSEDDMGHLVEDLGEEPSTHGGPMVLEDDEDAWEEDDGFSLDGETPEDPALPGLRRRLEKLQKQSPLQRMGVGTKILLARNLKRSELEFCWQTARAPWLPANWRNASDSVQELVGQIRGLLDQSFKVLSMPEAYAQALAEVWSALPQRQSRTADALIKRAQRECAAAKWDRALVVLAKAREANPTHARAVLLQTYAQVVRGQLPAEDAVAWVYAVSQHQSDLKLRAQGAYTAGRMMERLERPADAWICYRAAAQWQPDHAPSVKRLRKLKPANGDQPTGLGRCFDPGSAGG